MRSLLNSIAIRTQTQVARELGINRFQVRRAEDSAFKKIRIALGVEPPPARKRARRR